jgi:curved DNA-binding protein CbpA
VTPDASFREVQQAYWRRAFGGLDLAGREALNAAYDVLGNEVRRREFDEIRIESNLDRTGTVRHATQPLSRVDPGLRGKLGWPSI